jgi:5-hydroxyisourate hydrolase-like protein (transthyretin family)
MTQKGKIDLKDKVNAVTGLKNSVFYIESPLQDGQPEREYEELKAKDLVRRSQVPFINAFDKNLDAVKHEMQNLEDQKVTARLDQLNQIEDEIKKLTQEQRDKIGIKADRDSYLIDITAKKAAEEVVVALTKLSDEQLATLKSKIENVKSQSKQGSVKRVEGSRDSAPKEEQDQMILDQTILKLDKLNQIEDEIKNLTQEQRDKIGISADGDSYLIDITAKEAAEKVVVELTKLSDEQLATLESKIKNVKSQSNQGFAKRVEDSRDSAPKFER